MAGEFQVGSRGDGAAIGRMVKTLGAERVMWASDFPGIRKVMSLKAYVELCHELPRLGRNYGVEITDGMSR